MGRYVFFEKPVIFLHVRDYILALGDVHVRLDNEFMIWAFDPVYKNRKDMGSGPFGYPERPDGG